MKANHGQQIMVNEFRLVTTAICKRLVWSLIFGCVAAIAIWYFFAPGDLFTNVLAYLWSMLNFEFRKLPIFGVRLSDIRFVARTYAIMMHQSGIWECLLGVFVAASTALFAILTYAFWRRGRKEELDNFMRGAKLIPSKIHNQLMRKTYGWSTTITIPWLGDTERLTKSRLAPRYKHAGHLDS